MHVKSDWQVTTRLTSCVLTGVVSVVMLEAIVVSAQTGAVPRSTAQASDEASRHASGLTLRLDPAHTTIEFKLGATFHRGGVHGTMALVSGEIHFDPISQTISGRLVADATSAATGGSGRDRKMHKDVLESAAYPEIVFTPDSMEGDFYPDDESDLIVSGNLGIHGASHPITMPVHVRVDGNVLSAAADFDVPYVKWGMKNPSKFMFRVKKVVQVHLQFNSVLTRDTVSSTFP